MTLSFCSFSSGSSGNSYLVRSENTALLVDAGISGKKILNGLSIAATDHDRVKGLLITHEHSDHTKSIGTIAKKLPGLTVYSNEKTWRSIECAVPEEQKGLFVTGRSFMVGDIEVKPFQVSHDAADPVGFSFYAESKQISIVTDTGCICQELLEEIRPADILILEANHDVNMLKIGKYPWFLKQRVLSDHGHLSNEAAAEVLVSLLEKDGRHRCVLLAHLSRENNFPEMAYQTVKNVLEEANYYIGKHLHLTTLLRDEVSSIYQI